MHAYMVTLGKGHTGTCNALFCYCYMGLKFHEVKS